MGARRAEVEQGEHGAGTGGDRPRGHHQGPQTGGACDSPRVRRQWPRSQGLQGHYT